MRQQLPRGCLRDVQLERSGCPIESSKRRCGRHTPIRKSDGKLDSPLLLCRGRDVVCLCSSAVVQYERLGYAKATTLVASVALALQAAPLLLLRYGRTLRARSRVASALEGEREEDVNENT